jgi:asparagine synthase (glutamine-hydrolysing)
VPFLDHELVELAARVPANLKIAEGGKGVLKRAARRILPHEVIDRPKGYFPVPALKYIRGPYHDMVRELLSPERVRARGLFRPAYVEAVLADPDAHLSPLNGSHLWQMAVLEKWLTAHGIS